MSIEELYQKLGGSFAEVSERLPSLSLVERFIGKFLQDPSFNDLSESMNMGDRKGAFLASHTLKGICANLGFSALRKASGELCDELRGEGEGISDTAYLLMKDTERDYNVAVGAIREYLDK